MLEALARALADLAPPPPVSKRPAAQGAPRLRSNRKRKPAARRT
jgi:hypothetical protein